MVSGKSIHLLLVEDDDVDAEAIVRGFRKKKIANPFTIARDGIEALEMLRGENDHDRVPRPYMILLDLNMPRMNGLEFLEAIREDPELKSSIVFVLTTSKSDEDRVAAYEKNVAGYLVKTEAGDEFLDMIELFESYWRIVEFPPGQE